MATTPVTPKPTSPAPPSLTAAQKRLLAKVWKDNKPLVDQTVTYLLAKATELLGEADKSYEAFTVKFEAYLKAK